jgi:hypothetical protein
MPTISNWKLTFDPGGTPRVLLNYGDKLGDEFKFPFGRKVEEIDIADAAEPMLRMMGRGARRIEFTVWADEVSDRIARVRMMESMLGIDGLEKKPLRIQIDGQTDRYWQFANAAVVSHVPERILKSAAARWSQSYVIVATHFSQVGP